MGRCRKGAAPGKKPGAMQQIKVEVKMRETGETTRNFGSPTEILHPPCWRRAQVDSTL